MTGLHYGGQGLAGATHDALLRALKREHEVNARATKAAAAKRKQEQLEAAKSIR